MAPFLPPDLEREIFDIVASEGMKSIPPLLRVAQRVKLWMEPLLYRVMLVREGTLSDPGGKLFAKTRDALMPARAVTAAIQRLPSIFFHKHVRHLYLDCRVYTLTTQHHRLADARLNGYAVEDRDALLARCTGVLDVHLLNIQDAPSLLACLSRVPLLRLQANLGMLFSSVPEVHFNDNGATMGSTIDFSRPMFQHLTHLAVCDRLPVPHSHESAEWETGLASLPCLTHLSFEYGEPTELFLQLFDVCTLLRVLVILISPMLDEPMIIGPALEELKRHPRIAVMPNHNTYEGANDWHRGARGLGDYWDRAQKELQARRLEGRC
ncbi:hypothetical protein C8R47DRAFT_1207871 [Mycena vitilis]|nr:hypothetical protein C8R47DRAFT_1207871 [Mycena vitilis]